jgi:class 3 adenylate cyclase/tetratricopeptide (TPR) repeat protein
VCPSCGRQGSPFARFCAGCGAARTESSGSGASKAKRPGELKHATVLFADIVSSTERIANLDPEQAMDELQPAIAQMCDAIQRFGGTVLRTLGDGVMALFGAPRALEDHALLACQAALSMQQTFGGNGQNLAIRVGLHSGLVASDPASHDATRGGGAHGLVIHIASRVVALADPGCICLTEQCLDLLRGAAQTRRLGPRLLKGLREPVEVHGLEALLPAQAAGSPQLTAPSPFCGRDEELAVLRRALQRTRQSGACVVAVRGAPGCGKSRLCHEFGDVCRAEMIPVFQVRVQPYGHATPLQPILELLRAFLFKIPSNHEPALARERIAARVAEWPAAQPEDLGLLYDFLGVAEPRLSAAAVTPSADVPLRRARLLSILSGMIGNSATADAMIVLEDLHWLDEASEEFVSTMIDALQGSRTLLLLNYRPRAAAAWEKLSNFEAIDLHELSMPQTEELVRNLISHRAEFSSICHLIARRSAGNPFFAEELVRSIAQGSAFFGNGAANGPRFEFVDEALPETVQAVIAARIDRLKENQKKLLQICAIVGKEVPLEILEDVARPEVEQLSQTLQELCGLEFLQMPAQPPQLFAFGHPLIQEVAYATQLKATRSAIHALVGEAMEARYADRPEQAALIGHHFEAAGRVIAAARHVARAARWLSSMDTTNATRQWQRVRTLLLQQQQRTEEVDQLRLMASSQLAMLGWRSGCTLAEVQPFIDEAKTLAASLDQRLTQILLIVEGRMLQASGASADEYVLRAREALQLAAPEDTGRRAILNAALSHAYGRAGLMKEALTANEAAWRDRSLIDPHDRDFTDFGLDEWMLAMRGRSLARCGRLQEAEAAWQEMLRSPSVDPAVEAIAHLGRVEHAWCDGNAEFALRHSARMAELAAKRQVPYLRVVAQFVAGAAAAIANDFAVALPALTLALSLLRTQRVAIEFEPEILAALAECELRTGEMEAARGRASNAVRFARARGARIAECRALIVQGMAYGMQGGDLHLDSFDAAERLIELTGAVSYRAPLFRARTEFGGRKLRAS